MPACLSQNSAWLSWLGFGSMLVFGLTLVLVPIFIVRLPADYFAPDRRAPPAWSTLPSGLRVLFKSLKNLLGGLLVLIGVALLVLPGQGLFTILLGLMLLDLPGKGRLERRLLSHPRVLQSVNRLRRRYQRPPLRL